MMRWTVLGFLLSSPLYALVGGTPSAWLFDVDLARYGYNGTDASCDHIYTSTNTRGDVEADIQASGPGVYCFRPGVNMTAIRFTSSNADGVKWDPYLLVLHDGLETHPATFPTGSYDGTGTGWGQHAVAQISVADTDWVIVHRMTMVRWDGSGSVGSSTFLTKDANFVVADKLAFYNHAQAFEVAEQSNDIWLQRSYVSEQWLDAVLADRVCVLSQSSFGVLDPTPRSNKRLYWLDNEVRDCGDNFQLVRNAASTSAEPPDPGRNIWYDDVDYAGTVIDGNLGWWENRYDVNGFRGTGAGFIYGCGENIMDIKAASKDPDNPVIISNNRFWGVRPTPGGSGGPCLNSQDGTGGIAFAHQQSDYLIIRDNFFFDGGSGWGCNKGSTLGSCRFNEYTNNREFHIGLDPAIWTNPAAGLGNRTGLWSGTRETAITGNVYESPSNTISDEYLRRRLDGNNSVPTDKLNYSCNVVARFANVQGAVVEDINPITQYNTFFDTLNLITHTNGPAAVSTVYNAADWEDYTQTYGYYRGTLDSITYTDALPSQTLLDSRPAQCRFAPQAPSGIGTQDIGGGNVRVVWTAPTLRSDGTTAVTAVELDRHYVEWQGDRGSRGESWVGGAISSLDFTSLGALPDLAFRFRVSTRDNTALQTSVVSPWVQSVLNATLGPPASFDVTTSDGGLTFSASWTLQDDAVVVQQYNSAQARWDDLRTTSGTASTELRRVGSPNGANWEFRAVSRRFDEDSLPTTTIQVPVP